MCEETLDPAMQKGGDTKEGFYIGREPSAEELARHSHALLGGNQWPDENRLSSLAGWRLQMTAYFAEMSQLGHRLLRLVALALDLDADFFRPHFDRSMEVLRLLHYSDTVSDPDAGVFGAGSHSDYGMLTILSTDSIPGLEVYRQRPLPSVLPPSFAFGPRNSQQPRGLVAMVVSSPAPRGRVGPI
jgi:isopenicillin N synthase-like dioxygenase